MNNARQKTTLEDRKFAAEAIHKIYNEFGPAFNDALYYDVKYLMHLRNKELFQLKSKMEHRQRDFLIIVTYLNIQDDTYKKSILSLNSDEALHEAAEKIKEYNKKTIEAKKRGETYTLDWDTKEQILDLVDDTPISSNKIQKGEPPAYPDAKEEFLSDEELEFAYGTADVGDINSTHKSNILCMQQNGSSVR